MASLGVYSNEKWYFYIFDPCLNIMWVCVGGGTSQTLHVLPCYPTDGAAWIYIFVLIGHTRTFQCVKVRLFIFPNFYGRETEKNIWIDNLHPFGPLGLKHAFHYTITSTLASAWNAKNHQLRHRQKLTMWSSRYWGTAGVLLGNFAIVINPKNAKIIDFL